MSRPAFKRTLHLNRSEYHELLDRLDTIAAAAPVPDDGYAYRAVDIPLSIEHPRGGHSYCLVFARWISPRRICVLTGRYSHTDSVCRVVLTRSGGERMLVQGRVHACRLVDSPCHEIEIELREEIDPRLFEGAAIAPLAPAEGEQIGRGSVKGAVLVAEPFVPDLLLLEHHLASTGLEVRIATTPGATLDAIKRARADAVLYGLNIADDDGIHTLERMRDLGYSAPILLLTPETDPATLNRAHRAGATDAVTKPYHLELLMSQLEVHLGYGESPRRIYSTAPREPGMPELVERYVKFVRRAADQIDRTYSEREWDELRELCCQLKGSGVGYGFQRLTVTAILALKALERGGPSPMMDHAIGELIDCCRAVKLDTRSKAA
ncbi:MAG: response regulator [Planctomycetes bacterium]|nr:response regulator [Planctomycetota bacterium]